MCSFHIPEIRKATISPHAYAAHPTEADKPEECSLPLMRFVCRIVGTQLCNIFSFLLSWLCCVSKLGLGSIGNINKKDLKAYIKRSYHATTERYKESYRSYLKRYLSVLFNLAKYVTYLPISVVQFTV